MCQQPRCVYLHAVPRLQDVSSKRPRSSREAAAFESPARKCRVRVGKAIKPRRGGTGGHTPYSAGGLPAIYRLRLIVRWILAWRRTAPEGPFNFEAFKRPAPAVWGNGLWGSVGGAGRSYD